jgi:hypothetical protein
VPTRSHVTYLEDDVPGADVLAGAGLGAAALLCHLPGIDAHLCVVVVGYMDRCLEGELNAEKKQNWVTGYIRVLDTTDIAGGHCHHQQPVVPTKRYTLRSSDAVAMTSESR